MNFEQLINHMDFQSYIMSIARYLDSLATVKELKYKKLYQNVNDPERAHSTDMCFDIFAYSDPEDSDSFVQYKTGLIFEIPKGYDMLLYPRSSISKYDLLLCNSVGVIDQDYRGEVLVRFKQINKSGKIYQKGDRIVQATLIPKVNYSLQNVDTISSNTQRGDGGFGSTGV